MTEEPEVDCGDMFFYAYFRDWTELYKKGTIRDVTMKKYIQAAKWIEKLMPELKVKDLNRNTYQLLINKYGEEHERQTTMDFHHIVKGSIMDAVDDGAIRRDPTRKVVIKGKKPREKKIKYLNRNEFEKLIQTLELENEINWDWFILLTAKTGLRFAEGLALQKRDFDFKNQTLTINKTLDYKNGGGFAPTKNPSSMRTIKLDWKTCIQFNQLVTDLKDDSLVFIKDEHEVVYNSTLNDRLERKCKQAEIPVITMHGLRHTHASLLLYSGVSIASVAKRLGHSDMATTQKVYLHIISELENKDNNKIMSAMCEF